MSPRNIGIGTAPLSGQNPDVWYMVDAVRLFGQNDKQRQERPLVADGSNVSQWGPEAVCQLSGRSCGKLTFECQPVVTSRGSPTPNGATAWLKDGRWSRR